MLKLQRKIGQRIIIGENTVVTLVSTGRRSATLDIGKHRVDLICGDVCHISPDISLTVSYVKGPSASIGIDAPRDVRVDREEIRQRILAEGLLKASGAVA